MKKLLAILTLAAASLSQATVIQWDRSNDAGIRADAAANDGIYTGKVTLVEMNDLKFSDVDSPTPDALIGTMAIINLNTNKFLLSTSGVATPGNTLFSGDFNFDIGTSNFTTSTGYLLKNITINNSINSDALAEFATWIQTYPDAEYTFSAQGTFGNGQVASVPEPTTLGLMGLALVGVAFFSRRRKQS